MDYVQRQRNRGERGYQCKRYLSSRTFELVIKVMVGIRSHAYSDESTRRAGPNSAQHDRLVLRKVILSTTRASGPREPTCVNPSNQTQIIIIACTIILSTCLCLSSISILYSYIQFQVSRISDFKRKCASY